MTTPEATHELTAEQRHAVEMAGSVLVRAGAGSGKTVVLVERYVRAICGDGSDGPLELEQIIAVTFTEKAAAEMRDRIRQRLSARAGAADGEMRLRLVRLQRALASARIGTIHALAATLLRAAPVEAGIDPAARVLDEIEGPAYVEREVRRTLLARLRARDEDARRCARAWGFGAGGGELIAAVTDALARLARRGIPAAALDEAHARQSDAVAVVLAAARSRVAAMVRCIDAWLAGDAGAVPDFRERWPGWRGTLLALDDAPPDALIALREFPGEAGRAFRRRPEWREHADVVTFKMQDGTPRFGGVVAAAFGAGHGLELAGSLGRLVVAAAETLAAAKRRDGVLTFDDLISGATTMLREHPATTARLLGDVRAVLVDEFQDTDATQIELIQRIAAGGAELFAVGDEKQSIYRFRGADVEVFGAMRRTIGRELPLADNFRSRPALLAFVNGLAARLFSPSAGAPPWRVRWSPEQRLRARRGPRGGDARPSVRLVSLASQIDEHRPPLLAAQVRALEARVVAATISELFAAGWRPCDVAVLLPALTQVKAYEFALRRFAIPYEIVRGRGFHQCQEVRDLVHLLAAVVDADDRLALTAALRAPLFGISDAALERLAALPGGLGAAVRDDAAGCDLDPDDAIALAQARRVLGRLREARDRVPVAELLRRAIDETGIEQVLTAQFHGGQKVANVRKLVSLARGLGDRACFDAARFVGRARVLLDDEAREPEAVRLTGDVDAVQVMTVHQAKGLEFPVVVLPDLGREAPRDFRSPVVVDPRYGVLATATFGAGRHRLPHALIEEWRRDDRERGEAERARLLYVACTRARELLVLCEGRGRRAALAAVEPERSACEQIWAFLGRERVAAFVAGAAPRAVLDASGEDADGAPTAVAVEVEKSAALLARVPPPLADEAETSLARVLETTPSPADIALAARVLGRPAPAPSPLIVGPTALADHARCARQYWHRHVRGAPEDAGGPTGDEGGASTATRTGGRAVDGDARLGLAAHAALEILPFDLPAGAGVAAVTAALAGARDLDDAERSALAADLLAALERAAAEGPAFRVIGREVPFCFAVDEPPTLYVRGRIDLIGERDDHVVVRDYKHARAAGNDEAYRVQLEAYALAVSSAFPGRPLDVEIEWLRAPGGRVTMAIDIEAARARLRAQAAALSAAAARGRAEAFPRAFASPQPCRAIGCAFVTRCFPEPHRAFRDPAASASMTT